ncbi:MAG: PAS domain S-box protein, partial [Planctomycetaceae bacterium]
MANERILVVDDQPTAVQTCAETLAEDENGSLAGSQDTAHEISERGQEEKLRQSQDDYRQLFECAPDAILLIDNETGQILQANSAACTLYGFNREEMLAQKNTDLSAEPEQTRRITSGTRLAADQVVVVPLRYHRKNDGPAFPVEISGRFFLHQGRSVHIAVIRDITARKQAEDDLRNALAELTAIDQNAPIGMLLIDRDLRLHKVNDFTARFVGRLAVDMIGLRVGEALRCVHNLDDPRGCGFGPACASCLARQTILDTFESRTSGQDVEAWLSFLRGGSCVERCLLISTAYLEIDATERVLVCAQDITKQKRAEEQLEAEKAWSEAIVSAAPNIVVGLGERSTILIFNEAAERSTGYAAKEVMGREWIDLFVPKEMQQELYGIWDEIVTNRLIEHHYENLIITKTGERRLISWHNSVLTEDGKFRLVLSIGEDVTERKQAEAALHESEERYRSLVEYAPNAIYVHFDDRVLLVNRACLQLFGARSEVELLDKSIYDLFHPDFHPAIRERIHLVRNLGEPVPPFEEKILRLDGGVVDVEVTATPYPFGGGNAIHVIMRDITERKRDEEALQQRAWQLALLNEIGSKV